MWSNELVPLIIVLYSEVRQSLSNAQAQYSQWSMLLDSEVDIDKIQNVGSELKNCIKSIEWDLEDLDQTISKFISGQPLTCTPHKQCSQRLVYPSGPFNSPKLSFVPQWLISYINIMSVCVVCAEIAEANPNKFRLDYGELESRKQFIRDTRAVIKVRIAQLMKLLGPSPLVPPNVDHV